MRRKYIPRLKAPARKLRKDQTPAEVILWKHLRAKRLVGFRFRRQQPVGPYVVDFLCSQAKLVVEVDGDTHLGKEVPDGARQAYLEEHGLKVLRVWNTEVYNNVDGVLQLVLESCQSGCALSPLEGGGKGER